MSKQILILAGDGIGPEIVKAAEQVLTTVNDKFNLGLTWEHGLLGGTAIDVHGEPYPAVTAEQAKKADAILLGAVGGPKWDTIERSIRPERGLLKIRSELNLFANLRPAILYPQLADASSLKPEIVAGLDILIVRELTGGIYFGQPRGIRELANGEKRRCKVLEIDDGNALVQLFEASTGINLESSKVRFLGRSMELGVSEDMLSRVFDGLGRPIDGGPDILPEERRDINGLPMNPAAPVRRMCMAVC